jgi:predicted O-linked N-acetylglucosamine transferase (SPINDLY family)
MNSGQAAGQGVAVSAQQITGGTANLSVPSSPLLNFDAGQLQKHYQAGEHELMAAQFLAVLTHLRDVTYYHTDEANYAALNNFIKHFLYYMTQEDFILPEKYAIAFIDLNSVIGNVVAISAFRTTDPFVEVLLKQQRNYTKLLALYNARNRVKIDRRLLFATSPQLATQWYFCFLELYRTGPSDPETLEHLREHITFEDDRLIGINSFTHHAYFGATYIDNEKDYLVKQRINRLFQATPLCSRQISNTPKPKKIGVLSSMWFRRQSVYRSQHPFLQELAKDHELVLVHLGRPRDDLDTEIFSEVRYYNASQKADDISAVDPNDFAMAYFPDIGMSIESIILANMRIAPIQVSNYGHPVSTFGAKIDYWIGGRDTEAADRAREHYSERLVLIPGCAQAPVPLDYRLEYPRLDDKPVIVNCTWSGQKINSDHLQRLKKISERVKTPLKFHFFPGGAVLGNGYIPLKRAVENILGTEQTVVMPNFEFQQYMQGLERAHFAIDAHPFGGYNTAVDLLTLRLPIVTMAGNRFYNLSTAYLLNKVGLDELITRNEDDFLDVCCRMIDEPDFRDRMRRRMKIADLESTVLSLEHVPAFARAIDHLLEKHDSLIKEGSREPLVVE